MTVETVTHISDLNAAYPAGSDAKYEGDDHIRNIKTALTTDFPNITGPVTATQTNLNQLDGKTAYVVDGLDVALVDGGTGASTAADARTNLGLGALATLSSVTAAQIDADAVGSSEIAADAVGQSEIAAGAVGRGELKTSTASVSGNVASGAIVYVTLSAYSFFPMIQALHFQVRGHDTLGNADQPRFGLYNTATVAKPYEVHHRYIAA